MKKGTQQLVAIAGLMIGGFALWMTWAGPDVPRTRSGPGNQVAELPGAVDLDFPERGRAFVETPPPAPGMDGAPLPEGALPGQRVWHVGDPAALAALEARARAAGLTVRSMIPALGLIHVSGDEATLSSMLPPGAEEDFVYRVALPIYPEPTELSVEGLTSFDERSLEFLGVSEVPMEWGAGVIVAVLDTGVARHVALADAHIMGSADSGARADANGHGTAMTGLLAGRDAYARGLAPGAEILSVPILDAAGEGTTMEMARGIVEAVDRGAKVINISAGSIYDSSSLERAVEYAHARGAVIVAAAGNEGLNRVRYPAGYANVIGVTSVDGASRLPEFANTGQAVDMAAPGVGVYSAWKEDGYVSISGSSAAAPFVSGAIAMLMSEEPGMSANEAAELVLEYANEAGVPGRDANFGAGVLNVERLMRRDASGVIDLAVVTPYLALDEATATSAPIYLSLQNRGTEALSQTRLDLEVNGITYTHTVGKLGEGESRGVRLPIPLEDLNAKEGVTVKMEGWYRGDAVDVNPDNDAIEVVLRLASDGEESSGGEPVGEINGE